MNEATKATIQSLVRLFLNFGGGVWAAKNPDMAGLFEASIPVLFAAIWTWLDNRTKAAQPAPPVNITKTLGMFLVIAGLTTGCASTPQEKIVRFAAVAKSVSFEGSLFWLNEKPQHAETLQLVVDQLEISIKGQQFTPARLVVILKPLNIRELTGKEGRIAIASTIVVWDSLRLAGVIGDTSNLQPVFEGLRDGFKAALDATK